MGFQSSNFLEPAEPVAIGGSACRRCWCCVEAQLPNLRVSCGSFATHSGKIERERELRDDIYIYILLKIKKIYTHIYTYQYINNKCESLNIYIYIYVFTFIYMTLCKLLLVLWALAPLQVPSHLFWFREQIYFFNREQILKIKPACKSSNMPAVSKTRRRTF